jgi:RNA polymerase sigma factor (sigma-70 family)
MGVAPQELRDLLQATRPGERDAAWERFVDRFSPLLLHTARSIVRDYDQAMDAYAHLLEELRADDARRLRQYSEDPRTRFTTWLVVVARRLCHDHVRQRYGRVRETAQSDPTTRESRRRLIDLVAEELDGSAPLADPADSPDAELARRDRTAALQASLAQLPSADRLLLAMRFEDDRPVREIAALLGYPTPFHVYRAVNAVLQRLRRSLRQRGVSDPGL